MPNLESHIPVTHLFITNSEPPMLKHDLVVYLDANEKITLQPDPPKTYNNDLTRIIYKVEAASNTPAGYYHPEQIVIECKGKPHIVETIIDGEVRNTVVNSSDRAEPE